MDPFLTNPEILNIWILILLCQGSFMLNIEYCCHPQNSLYHHFRPQWYHLHHPPDVQCFSVLPTWNCENIDWWWEKWWYGGLNLFFGPLVMFVNHSIFKIILKMLHLLVMMRNFQNLTHLYITCDAYPISYLANNF